ncbi:tyrosine-type recombinase/integrase [Xenorhabdus bovienii]|uniref:Tyrosine-type recombinase/integrase n=2 Tax=Xenorhabdus bovienii TaxID=40576 RepID=A0AAJ1N2K9_XENBV|nr:site-specific integrase [Xenorhabdus bovienii]MDE1479772.1 tyrosine-type recombinase/integrase [Xenorhabdus bovienii]MDE1488463.1 tyrosine-type recombinase/integrase [Xenorhabdus bovienii]MDE1491129.1 tyrosine-type recombinase/integrase [Xenorhabdus bovienii]MDE9455453.1 tyrosine-type recombinase/integrase [Xenorhabdus bovienii]MDE9479316.1 tyrosine-type recombinase/integrase [Xenorhabdus bovienii]
MAITDSWLRSINGKPQEKITTKSDRDGLSVRITPKGKIIFQFRYRWNSKGDRIDIGTYPATGLKDARDSVILYRGELEQHRNPKIVKRVRKESVLSAVTVEGLIRDWWKTTMQGLKVRADDILRSFEIYVFPKIGKLPHDEVTLHVWLSLIEDVAKEVPSIGNRILTYSKKAHKWAVRRGMTNLTPLSDVEKSDLSGKDAYDDTDLDSEIGERTLSEEELVVLFQLINASRYNPRNALIIKLCLLFGCRIGELLKAKVSDFDYEKDVWIVPPKNHKTGRRSKKPIIRPITPAAKELIEQAKTLNHGNEYLFIVSSGGPFAKSSYNAIVKYLNKKMASYLPDYESWSIHDLRRTMRTGVSELTSPHVAEIMIGHKLPGVWQVYDKHTYLNEQREAYERWWDKLTKIVSRPPSQEYPAVEN